MVKFSTNHSDLSAFHIMPVSRSHIKVYTACLATTLRHTTLLFVHQGCAFVLTTTGHNKLKPIVLDDLELGMFAISETMHHSLELRYFQINSLPILLLP